MKGKRFTTEEKIRIRRDADQLNLDIGSVRYLSGYLKDDQPLPDYICLGGAQRSDGSDHATALSKREGSPPAAEEGA